MGNRSERLKRLRRRLKRTISRPKTSEVVRPAGRRKQRKPERATTATYANFDRTGTGANDAARPAWAQQLTAAQAAQLTPAAVLRGKDGWNPATGIFTAVRWNI